MDKDKKLVVLHVINRLGMGGAELLLKNTLPLLEEYTHIVCCLDCNAEQKDFITVCPVHCLHHSSHLHLLRSVNRLRKLIKKNAVSIVHAHLFESTLIARLACPRNVKLVFTIHNLLSKDAFEVNRLSLWAEKLTYKKGQAIIGVSDGVIKDYDNYVGLKGPTHVVYNYIEDKFFESDYEFRENLQGNFRLVAVGNLRRQKNYENLLKAFALLKGYPISLDIYGSGDLQDTLQKIIDSERITVSLKGSVQDVAAILPNYDAYIMSSLYEGYGIAPMEAMAAGMPVLLSDIEVFREVAENCPVYFEAKNPASIATAIRNVYEDWDTIKKHSAGNRNFIFEKASKKIYQKKLLDVYRQVLTTN